jgi:hypothetical protein
MQGMMLGAVLALVAVSIVVGVKVLRLAQRTRGLPERLLGSYFLVGGGVGYPLSAVSSISGEWQPILASLSSVFISVALSFLFVFTARVFYGKSRAAQVGAWLGIAMCLAYALGYSISQLSAETEEALVRSTMTWGGLSLFVSAAAFGWTGVESLRHWTVYRRRVLLGLADAVAVNRMLLWGLMGTIILAVVAIDTLLLYTGGAVAREVLVPLVTSVGGIVSSLCLALAFLPPRSYLEAVRRRAAASAGAL